MFLGEGAFSYERGTPVPHEFTQANRIKPYNRIKGRHSLVTLQRSPLRGLRVPFVVQTPRSPFHSVRLCRLVWYVGSQKNLMDLMDTDGKSTAEVANADRSTGIRF